jgi:aromatic ring hydroxylase
MMNRYTFAVLLINRLREYLDYIDYCERHSIANEISDMTANMSEISAYNVGMRKQAEKWSNATPEMYMLEAKVEEVE